MPRYRYTCADCSSVEVRLVRDRSEAFKCECGGEMSRGVPNIADPITLERKDPWRNKQVLKDMDSILKARSKKHFTEFEIKSQVEKWGEGHGKAQGWVKRGRVRKFEDYT